jgi:hypothetical protein
MAGSVNRPSGLFRGCWGSVNRPEPLIRRTRHHPGPSRVWGCKGGLLGLLPLKQQTPQQPRCNRPRNWTHHHVTYRKSFRRRAEASDPQRFICDARLQVSRVQA